MKNIIKALLVLIAIYIGYYGLSQAMYYYAWYRGDYPQPDLMSSVPYVEGKAIDWFLVHGASASASEWKTVIEKNSGQNIVAISLGKHNLGPKLADPTAGPVDDIIKFMKMNRIKKGIIGHSSAAIWLALAYEKEPKLFEGIKMYLLAPNVSFIKVSQFELAVSKLLPDIHWAFLPIKPCRGSKDYESCKKLYMGGRKYRINSMRYYLKLLEFYSSEAAKRAVDNLLEKNKQLEFVLAKGDRVINNKKLISLLTKNGHGYIMYEGSHHDIIEYASEIIRASRK